MINGEIRKGVLEAVKDPLYRLQMSKPRKEELVPLFGPSAVQRDCVKMWIQPHVGGARSLASGNVRWLTGRFVGFGPKRVARAVAVVNGKEHSIVNGVMAVATGTPATKVTPADRAEPHCRPAASRSWTKICPPDPARLKVVVTVTVTFAHAPLEPMHAVAVTVDPGAGLPVVVMSLTTTGAGVSLVLGAVGLELPPPQPERPIMRIQDAALRHLQCSHTRISRIAGRCSFRVAATIGPDRGRSDKSPSEERESCSTHARAQKASTGDTTSRCSLSRETTASRPSLCRPTSANPRLPDPRSRLSFV